MTNKILLFDLGGVLIKLRIAESLTALTTAYKNWDEIKSALLSNPVILKFDRGQCTPEEFAHALIDELDLPLSVEDFITEVATWPVGFFDGATDLLGQLRQQHTVACLSNTNELHWQKSWETHFDHSFASHLIGFAKPDPAAFTQVMNALNLPADQFIFFDDALPNIETATSLGMEAHHTDGFDALTQKLKSLALIA